MSKQEFWSRLILFDLIILVPLYAFYFSDSLKGWQHITFLVLLNLITIVLGIANYLLYKQNIE